MKSVNFNARYEITNFRPKNRFMEEIQIFQILYRKSTEYGLPDQIISLFNNHNWAKFLSSKLNFSVFS